MQTVRLTEAHAILKLISVQFAPKGKIKLKFLGNYFIFKLISVLVKFIILCDDVFANLIILIGR
jgi:hypothetical protein